MALRMQYSLRGNIEPVAAPETNSMPLNKAAPREVLHQRDIQVWGYRRTDGLYDIEGHLTDTKPFAIDGDRGRLPPGTPLHGMWMRLTIDADMTIVASEACTEFGPFATCPGGAASYTRLVGLTIKPGFLRAANERLGGPAGCTHIREMLQQMATTAFQAMWPVRSRRAEDRKAEAEQADNKADGSVALINTCYAYASDGPVVLERWPHLYTGSPSDGGAVEPAQAAMGPAKG
jgi:hypothetical protein